MILTKPGKERNRKKKQGRRDIYTDIYAHMQQQSIYARQPFSSSSSSSSSLNHLVIKLSVLIPPRPHYPPLPHSNKMISSDKEPHCHHYNHKHGPNPLQPLALICLSDSDDRNCEANVRENQCPPSQFEVQGADLR